MVRRALLVAIFAVLTLQGRAQEAAPYLVEAAFDSDWAYQGQAVTYTVTAYSDTARDVIFDMPAFEGFWQADARAFGGSATVGGKQYNTAIYQVRLYPQQPGKLELAEARAEFEETVFSAGAIRLSNQAVLEVMELPPGPDEFSGLVGVVAAEFSAQPPVVGLGEPVAVTLTLRGSANLAQWVRPELLAPEGWRIYDQPGQAVPEPSGHAFDARCASRLGRVQVAAQSGEIFVVFGEQSAEQPVWRDDAVEPPGVVDDGQGEHAVLDGLPGGVLLVGVGGDGGRRAVHHLCDGGAGGRGEQALDGGDAHEAVGVADRHHRSAVEPLAA